MPPKRSKKPAAKPSKVSKPSTPRKSKASKTATPVKPKPSKTDDAATPTKSNGDDLKARAKANDKQKEKTAKANGPVHHGRKKTKAVLNQTPSAKSAPLDIFVWGTGSMCELGLGPEAKTKEVKRPRLNPFLLTDKVDIVDFSCGGMHTLALDKNNQLWSWGANDSGVLGRSTVGKEKLKDIKEGEDDDDDGDLNDAESTPGLVEGLPEDCGKIIQLATSDNLSCVLYENGEVYSWGTFRGNDGILGFTADVRIQSTPVRISELSYIVQLASGKDHMLALDAWGNLYGWGDGQNYQLGRKIMDRTRLIALKPFPISLKNIKYVASGDYHSFAISTSGDVYAWGLSQYGQCGIKETLSDGDMISRPTKVDRLSDKQITSIAAGEHHTLALSSDGSLYVFGRVDMFELGIAKKDFPEYSFKDANDRVRAVPFPTLLKNAPKFKQVSAGPHHNLGITEDGVAYSWGYGDTYAVGQGPAGEDIEIPTRIKNTATQNHNITLISCGGQFCVSGGIKLSEEEADKREDRIEEFEESRD